MFLLYVSTLDSPVCRVGMNPPVSRLRRRGTSPRATRTRPSCQSRETRHIPVFSGSTGLQPVHRDGRAWLRKPPLFLLLVFTLHSPVCRICGILPVYRPKRRGTSPRATRMRLSAIRKRLGTSQSSPVAQVCNLCICDGRAWLFCITQTTTRTPLVWLSYLCRHVPRIKYRRHYFTTEP